MRIVFIGTAEFAVPSLRAVAAAGHQLPLVVSQPDRPGHRFATKPPPVKQAALELGLAVSQPEKIANALADLQGAAPELIVVVAYGQIIPASVLRAAPRGVLNVHASLLPRHRGAAPVAHAILAGDRVTGVTIMQMDEQLDHGPVLAMRQVEIGPEEDALTLTARLASVGAELLVETIAHLDQARAVPQAHDHATLAPKLARSDGELSWSMPAREIDRRVRAFTPWPGVTLPWRGGRIKVLRGGLSAALVAGARAGDVIERSGQAVDVATGAGAYRLIEVQLPGRRPMAAAQLLAGNA